MGRRREFLGQLSNHIDFLTDTLSSKTGSLKNHQKLDFLDVLINREDQKPERKNSFLTQRSKFTLEPSLRLKS